MKNSELIEDISILIAEDESELREYLQEYLQIFFKKVYIAKCGNEGYMQYLEKRPDIILTDINMPNLDGLSMIKRIRERDDETDIIIMSAHSEQEKLLQAIELKLVTYLIKPINSQKLKGVLLSLVDKLRSSKKRIYLSQEIFWDKTSSTLWNSEKQISLKDKELMLFKLLCSKVNHAFTAENIFYHLYGEGEKEFSEYSITSFIKRLRAKLPENLIENEYGLGYKIVLK
ncbi:response regulator transcription factor [Sulfurimonas sp.]|uniref:response regulator transcription factor n=1 Tax=Sulfurimonas sp. TaxID=2022749 RepID=UPI0025E715F8|nr:response regulator transcription factor [Sulfurimonas sp.]